MAFAAAVAVIANRRLSITGGRNHYGSAAEPVDISAAEISRVELVCFETEESARLLQRGRAVFSDELVELLLGVVQVASPSLPAGGSRRAWADIDGRCQLSAGSMRLPIQSW
jgi:hypothetical protein